MCYTLGVALLQGGLRTKPINQRFEKWAGVALLHLFLEIFLQEPMV